MGCNGLTVIVRGFPEEISNLSARYDDNLVSIITPAYNSERFIGETIESVQAQNYQKWELLITDDCSTDRTCDVVSRYAANDSRLKLLRNATNSGPAVARRSSYASAAGRFIAFLDSDDLWLPTKLERQLAFIRQRNVGYTFTAYRRISEDGKRCGHLIGAPHTMNYWQLISNTIIQTSTVIMDRGKVGELEFVDTYYDDLVFKLSVLKRGFLAYGMLEDLMRYRVVGRSVSRNKLNSAIQVWRTMRNIEHLDVIRTSLAFAGYAIHAVIKYSRF